MSAYNTTTKSFMGVMLRQTDADQAHFNPPATKGEGSIHPLRFIASHTCCIRPKPLKSYT